MTQTVEQFGGIDICVNNASAINLGSIKEVPLKRFDLMNGIQVRGTYTVSQACTPHMIGRENPHVLTLSPPIRLKSKWLKPTAYMMAKFGMTLCASAIAEELREDGVASNTLWPRPGRDRRGAEPPRRRRGDGACAQTRLNSSHCDPTPIPRSKRPWEAMSTAAMYSGDAADCEMEHRSLRCRPEWWMFDWPRQRAWSAAWN